MSPHGRPRIASWSRPIARISHRNCYVANAMSHSMWRWSPARWPRRVASPKRRSPLLLHTTHPHYFDYLNRHQRRESERHMELFNTLTQRIEPLHPHGNEVTLYVCGVTPYDTTHLGHAAINVYYDTLIRFLRSEGQVVNYVQNVTDID